MSEEKLVEVMYAKHGKMLLDMKEACNEWGMSYSAATKLFGGEDSLSEKTIIERKIIPTWIKVGNRRMWKITDIVKWLVETENEK